MLDDFQGNKMNFQCGQCSESFKKNFSLTLHRTVVHSDVKTLECNQSGKVYNLEGLVKSRSNSISTSQNSQNDLNPNTEHLENKITHCTDCKKSFNTRSHL